MFESYRVIHFVGIGGIGMSGIAEVLHNLGYDITGSDLKESSNTRRLREMGIKVFIGHNAANVDSAHVVVVSSAVKEDNPEVVEAMRMSIPVIPRAEMLAELGRLKYSILVAGSHGKTTTTSLISSILSNSGIDPTVVIGGRLKSTGSNVRLGQGEFLVAEADESDGSFLKLSPTIALATNVDREHMDFFKTMDSLYAAFREFLNKVPFYGVSIVCYEDVFLRNMISDIRRKHITYGFSKNADIRADNIKTEGLGTRFNLSVDGELLGELFVPVIGKHNVLNCLGAIAVALELHVDFNGIMEGLSTFTGIHRRFEFKGEVGGIKVYDDYGHHPTELRATIGTIRDAFDGRIVVVFQPHRYSRTRDLFGEFLVSFDGVDALYLMDIYAAGEVPVEGVSSERLSDGLKDKVECVKYIKDRGLLIKELRRILHEGDFLLTLGAGDVWKIGEDLLRRGD